MEGDLGFYIDPVWVVQGLGESSLALRSMSKGRATYYMEPSHYEEVPRNIQEKIIEKEGRMASDANKGKNIL